MQINELEVWKSAMDLAKNTFELANKFHETGGNGLAAQLRRATTAIPSNIAAAASRKYGKESLKYLFNAKGHIYEAETMFYLAEMLHYISEEERNNILEQLDTSRRLLFGFIKYYKRNS